MDLELGVRGKAENEGPLMTSPYSVNRDKTCYQAYEEDMRPTQEYVRETIQHDWHIRKCKRVFMMQKIKNIESWEDKTSDT